MALDPTMAKMIRGAYGDPSLAALDLAPLPIGAVVNAGEKAVARVVPTVVKAIGGIADPAVSSAWNFVRGMANAARWQGYARALEIAKAAPAEITAITPIPKRMISGAITLVAGTSLVASGIPQQPSPPPDTLHLPTGIISDPVIDPGEFEAAIEPLGGEPIELPGEDGQEYRLPSGDLYNEPLTASAALNLISDISFLLDRFGVDPKQLPAWKAFAEDPTNPDQRELLIRELGPDTDVAVMVELAMISDEQILEQSLLEHGIMLRYEAKRIYRELSPTLDDIRENGLTAKNRGAVTSALKDIKKLISLMDIPWEKPNAAYGAIRSSLSQFIMALEGELKYLLDDDLPDERPNILQELSDLGMEPLRPIKFPDGSVQKVYRADIILRELGEVMIEYFIAGAKDITWDRETLTIIGDATRGPVSRQRFRVFQDRPWPPDIDDLVVKTYMRLLGWRADIKSNGNKVVIKLTFGF